MSNPLPRILPRCMSHRPWFQRPAFWLIVQPLALLVFLTATGGMAPHEEPDTASYLDRADFSSWTAAASHMRTLAYPAFLRAVNSISLRAAPFFHFALHAAAVAALFAGLRCYGFSTAAALAAASTLYYSGFFLQYVRILLPDAAASSAAVLTIACLMAVVARGGKGAWIGLGVFLALTYHLKPAYLFLAAVAPVLGVLLAWLRRPASERPARLWRLGGGLALTAVVPYVAYCGLRWATVGHFGLVSFGGFSVLGISGQWLTPELVQELPRDLQPLARAVLQRAQETPGWKPQAGYYDMFANYDPLLYQAALPAAREIYGDDNSVVLNDRLGALGTRLIALRPGAYVRWLAPAAKHGAVQLFEYSFLDVRGLAMLSLLVLCQTLLVVRWRRGGAPAIAHRGANPYFLEYHAAALLALTFAATKLSLVILVEAPIHRYVAPAAVFLPMWLAVAIVDRVQRLTAASS